MRNEVTERGYFDGQFTKNIYIRHSKLGEDGIFWTQTEYQPPEAPEPKKKESYGKKPAPIQDPADYLHLIPNCITRTDLATLLRETVKLKSGAEIKAAISALTMGRLLVQDADGFTLRKPS